jgi:hypothetical protein
VDRHARAVHVRIDVPSRRHEEGAGVHTNLALQAAVDGDVLAARDFTGDDERRSNSGHGVQSRVKRCPASAASRPQLEHTQVMG